tara:strand:+ start:1286 stop:2773 length:1488 start_codon:yes stop_codon:yes gene_type:complete
MSCRVRFAPSPTGPLHIGGLRTALYNYLFAKKNKGSFILRIEDTDQSRSIKESEEYINKSLNWAGINPDESPINNGDYGPYRQSERKKIYNDYIVKLIENKKAYYAFDSDEELNHLRAEYEKKGETFKYDHLSRKKLKNSLTLSNQESERLKQNNSFVIRLKVDPNKIVSVEDKIRGYIEVNSNTLDDKVLIKSDGMPTYHFANVIDDHLMKITTVIRGEEWLPSLPFHKLLYQSFKWNCPEFMHLPLILKPAGKGKLSKRDSEKTGIPIFPLSWKKENIGYKEIGFLPNGLINYLALLGWNDNTDKEIYSLKELENVFDFKKVQKSGAKFDYEKAKWINHNHIKILPSESLLKICKKYLENLNNSFKKEEILTIISLVKDRVILITDLKKETLFFSKNPDYNNLNEKLFENKDSLRILKDFKQIFSSSEGSEKTKNKIVNYGSKNNIKLGFLMQLLRIAIVGELKGPDLFSIIKIIGKNVSLNRIENLISKLNS